jgi:hypothetical protein
MEGYISRRKEAVWALESPFPSHSRLVFLLPLLYKVFPSHIPSSDTSFQADSLSQSSKQRYKIKVKVEVEDLE